VQRRRLGGTGREVGALGAATCGIATYRGVDPGDARRALSHAVERGVDLIDVAADRDLERMVGEIVRELRAHDRATIVATVPAAGEAPPERTTRLHRVYAPGWVQAAVEGTLRAGRFEVVPIAVLATWFDDWLDDLAWPELNGALARLIREGKVLHWGVAAADPADAVRAAAEPGFDVVAAEYNLFDRRADAALWPAVREHGKGAIVRAPLAGGALGGELGPGVRLRPDDARARRWPADRLDEVAVRIARLAEHVADPPPVARASDPAREALETSLARRRGVEVEARSVAELALRASLTASDTAAAVVGMRTRAHVDANLAAGDGRALTAALRERLAEHAWPGGQTPMASRSSAAE
jgi:aryl-alcohol dehydrogenase-like predicted oxidoreductase